MQNLESLVESFLNDLVNTNGKLVAEGDASRKSLDAKLLEFRMLLSMLSAEAKYLQNKFDNDPALNSNDNGIRLKTLIVYSKATLKLLKDHVIHPRSMLIPAPDFSRLTESFPGLNASITNRWKEAQICQQNGAYLSTIIMIGSILEGLLLARATLSTADVLRTKLAPDGKDGQKKPLQEWTLYELIGVAIEIGWLRMDYRDFENALLKFHFLIHPWGEVSARLDVTQETCNICWKILDKSIDHLLKSI